MSVWHAVFPMTIVCIGVPEKPENVNILSWCIHCGLKVVVSRPVHTWCSHMFVINMRVKSEICLVLMRSP